MNYISKILALVMSISLCSIAQASANSAVPKVEAGFCTIKGEWLRDTGNGKYTIALYEVQNGSLVEMATYHLGNDKRFYFAFPATKPGFYVIGSVLSPDMRNRYSFYFNQGDHLNVRITADSYELTGVNTKENVEVDRWHKALLPLETIALYDKDLTYKEFFPLLTQKAEELKNFKPLYTKNAAFNKAFEDLRKLDLIYDAAYMVTSIRKEYPKPDGYSDFYKNISLKDITSGDAILNYPQGLDLVNRVESISIYINSLNLGEEDLSKIKSSAIGFMERRLENITNPTMKGEYLIQRATTLKTYAGYDDYKTKYGNLLVDKSQRDRLDQIGFKFITDVDSKNVKAVEFTGTDINGNKVSMSDFKGKVVYIDFWATWCGPCLAQVPYLKKLEAEMHGENIVFLSVSLDKIEDMDKWKAKVAELNLTGVQLFAGESSKLLNEAYKITGIPRFILIGKDGSILNNNAPRPSSEEIRPVIKSALTK